MDSINFKGTLNVRVSLPSSKQYTKKHTLNQYKLVLGFTPTSFILITTLVSIRTTGFKVKPLHLAHAQYNYRVRTFLKGKRLFPHTALTKGSSLCKISVFSVNINYTVRNIYINIKFRTDNDLFNATLFSVSPSCLFPSGYCPICIIHSSHIIHLKTGVHLSRMTMCISFHIQQY